MQKNKYPYEQTSRVGGGRMKKVQVISAGYRDFDSIGQKVRVSVSERSRELERRLAGLLADDEDGYEKSVKSNTFAECNEDKCLTESFGVFACCTDSSRSCTADCDTAADTGNTGCKSCTDH